MKRNHFLVFVVAISLMVNLGAGSVCLEASEITGQLKNTIDKVIEIVTDDRLKSNKKARREALRATINKRFNYHQMVMRSLAKNWKKRSDQERLAFTDLFKRLLEHSYASKLEAYSDEKINYVGEVVKGNMHLSNRGGSCK